MPPKWSHASGGGGGNGGDTWLKDLYSSNPNLRPHRSASPTARPASSTLVVELNEPASSSSAAAASSSSFDEEKVNRQIVRSVMLACCLLFALLTFVLMVFWLTTQHTESKHHHPQQQKPLLPPPPPPPPLTAEVALRENAFSLIRVVVRFNSKSTLQQFERYDLMPNVSFAQLVSYDVCCEAKGERHRLVCSAGSRFGQNGEYLDVFAESELQPSTGEEVVFLFLWINSQNLIEVGCWLEYTVLAG